MHNREQTRISSSYALPRHQSSLGILVHSVWLAFIMPAASHADTASREKGRLAAKRARISIKTLMLASARLQPSISRKGKKDGKKGDDLSLDALGG